MGELQKGFVRTSAPLYRDVAAVLEKRIRSGAWRPGDQIPPEKQLEKEFGASRGTLRAAVSELVKHGLLYPQAGRGTFVLGPSFNSLERYFRYEGIGDEPRLSPQNEVLRTGSRKADARIAAALGVERGTDVGHVRRLRIHDGEPFLLVDSYFQPAVWARIANTDFRAYPLYDALRDDFGIYIVSADEYLRADIVKAQETRLLRVKAGSAVIRLERTAFTFEKRPVEYRRATGRADRFQYHVRLE
ncbi:MAG: GntR family transcriptional regulator [Betaproteobacteria bacterium]|nr:GntR family transcriptional regulator [Betaproteobacteria bacterium]